MKPIYILKKLINFYYYFVGFGLGISFISLVYRFFVPKMINPHFLESDTLYSSNSIKVVIIQLLYLGMLFIFFKSIELLTKSLSDLSEGNHFSPAVIKNFKNSGKLFIMISIIEISAKIFTNLFLENKLIFEIDTSIILFPIIGLFFLYLHEVFSKARTLQNENDLTI
ncbi:DUF2975 domain-containing protein [uncultured Aquimarina sp.]|uniref:DUF2975 domain-containing protein n=1 Tax=uncultured Aquimarina sp. TaxID=575652 RepID=UPI0026312468|nr:DUF2975 domain-containing protein [uncultured Aquimarina sp.]